MKATLNHAGLMTIEPETPLEAYALGQWAKHNYVAWPSISCPVTGENGMWKGSGMLLSADCGKVGSPLAAGDITQGEKK
jgi:hypothetical protein